MGDPMSSIRLMAGVPTGYLDPQLPFPPSLHTATVGLELAPGLGELTLRALEIPGRSVMDVRRVTLTLRP